MDNIKELKERRQILYQDTIDEIISLVQMINQTNCVIIEDTPELIISFFGEKMAIKALFVDDNNRLKLLCCNRSSSQKHTFYTISNNLDCIDLLCLFDIIDTLNSILNRIR